MGKRCNYEPTFYEPPVKKSAIEYGSPTVNLKPGTILTDVLGKKWKLGKSVGTGGFGEIYLASDNINNDVKTDAPYVAKVESHSSGPLFVEIHCYLRIAKPDMINEWKEQNNLNHLGMPHYIASGSQVLRNNNKYRFLIIPRFEKDLEDIFEAKNCKFNLKTVLTIAYQTTDVLRYIHSKGYIHSDIKASNILFNSSSKLLKSKPLSTPSPTTKTLVRYHGCRPMRVCKARKINFPRLLRPNVNLRSVNTKAKQKEANEKLLKCRDDQIYLSDFGLASKYVKTNGEHKSFTKDARKAHAGTILFCSCDAHQGVQSRRSDLECLGYNIIYWLTKNLPWEDHADHPELVYRIKQRCMKNIRTFLDVCFNSECPRFLFDYFNYLQKLEFEEEPDYNFCQNLFKDALKEYGYKDNLRLDFDNLEGWGRKQKKTRRTCDNFKIQCVVQMLKRSPLKSNLPNLRKKKAGDKKMRQNMKWSKILMDPEIIMKNGKSKEKKSVEVSDSSSASMGVLNLDLNQLNPTAAMIEIFNRSLEKFNATGSTSPRYRGDVMPDKMEGYTPAMMEVYNRKKEREEFEYQQLLVANSKLNHHGKSAGSGKSRSANNNNNNKKQQTKLKGVINSNKTRKQNVRATKSQPNVVTLHKKEATQVKHSKTLQLRRTYSLRG